MSTLRTEPSFSIYSLKDGVVENDENGEKLERTVTIGEMIKSVGSGEFSFGKNGMALIKEDNNEEEGKGVPLNAFECLETEDDAINQIRKSLAAGLGVDGDAIGGGMNSGQSGFDGNGDLEEYYKRMIREDPSDPLSLRTYAQLLQVQSELYVVVISSGEIGGLFGLELFNEVLEAKIPWFLKLQCFVKDRKVKGDLSGAQDYYFRATLAHPTDGEVLVQYAKFLWESLHDKDGALSYFRKAAVAAPEDSHVLGALASFLWDMDDDDDERSSGHEQLKVVDADQEDFHNIDFDQGDLHNIDFVEENRPASPPLHLATGLGIDMGGFGGRVGAFKYVTADCVDAAETEEYYRMMVEEHPLHPLSLRNFAQFLSEIKGDLQAAEEYYSRAILADPSDAETLSQYGTLIWQLHNDGQKASSYFEQAVQAASENSYVLGAYARFLWESDNGEVDDLWKDPLHQGAAAATTA